MTHGHHELVRLWDELPEMVQRQDGSWTDELTVEAWVLWESSDLEEIQAATGLDIERMTLLCGNRAYGFQYGSNGSHGWTFFLQTTDRSYPDTGTIPLPRGEWAHLAATYDGSVIRTFLNGVKQTETRATGGVMFNGENTGNPDFPDQCRWTELDEDDGVPLISRSSFHLAIGVGTGFTGGVRQLRLWNRALSENELSANASIYLEGNKSGLVGYWPMDDPFADVPPTAPGSENFSGLRYLTITNKANGDFPLYAAPGPRRGPSWRLTEPLFVVREDLAEDMLVTDCPSLPAEGMHSSSLVDIHRDGDLDLVISGVGGLECFGDSLTRVEAMIRDGDNGFVWDVQAAFAGEPLLSPATERSAVGDFNGDGQTDIFIGVGEPDFCPVPGQTEPETGAPNTLLLSRPDGRLEDASDNLLGRPCTAEEPLFEGQHPCYGGAGGAGRTPGIRYPADAEPVPLVISREVTHGLAAGDIDGDGDLDIALANLSMTGLETPYILINNGQGRFVADWDLLPDIIYSDFNNGKEAVPQNFLLEDMDGDGHVDLIISPGAKPQGTDNWVFGIYWNDGSGDFSETVPMIIEPTDGIPGSGERTPGSTGSMVAPDIDNDGDKDLVISWRSVNFGLEPESLQILVNQGGRVFVDETLARIGAPPQADLSRGFEMVIHAEDVNYDGCVDILFIRDTLQPPTQLGAGIWFNDCMGNFSPSYVSTFTKQGGYFFPLDYDDDGDIDLISLRNIPVNLAGTEGCAENEGGGTDYYDLAVLLNQTMERKLINAGHSGAWFNTATSGQGQFIDVEPESQFMFISWFTHTDTASANPFEQRWFTAQGNYSGNTAELPLFETLGGKFDDPQEVTTNQVGEVTVSFSDCGQGQMTYSLEEEGLQGSFPLLRVIPGSENVCEDLAGASPQAVDINAGMDGAWFNPDTPGQGFFIDAHPDPEGGNFIFVSWFTYGEDTASGQRWLTAQGSFAGSIAEIDVFETTGGSFDDPQATSTSNVGTMSLDFTDCSNALLTYALTDSGAEGDRHCVRNCREPSDEWLLRVGSSYSPLPGWNFRF